MQFLRDVFYSLRLVRRNPAFYLLGVLIISLGVGASTAIFSLIDGVLLKSASFPRLRSSRRRLVGLRPPERL
jgi:hypothetical protein